MKKIYFIKSNKCIKSKNPKMSYILNKKLVLCIIFDKLDSKNQKNFE